MRVVPCLLVVACLCLGPASCSLFNKRPKDDAAAKKDKSAQAPAPFPGAGAGAGAGAGDPIRDTSAATRNDETTTLIAGTVRDEYNNRPREAYVRWVCLDDPKKDEAPIDVAVSPEGYFTIRGVKANQHYKLIARAKDGSRVIAGVEYVTAPNIHVLIRMRADLANAETPPIPGAPAYTPKKQEGDKSSANASGRPATAATPAWGPTSPAPVSVGSPRPMVVPDLQAPVSIPTPTSPPPQAPAQQQVTPASSSGWVPGVVKIPNQVTPPPPPVKIEPPVPLSTPSSGAPLPGTRVPSCVLVGNRLINLALYDLNRQPWEYKTQHRGKLVLLDFWGTWCGPCQQTIPQLVTLQSRYGVDGLEIIGLAYEQGGSVEEQARRVGNACQARQINYRVLLGGDTDCPVRSAFAIRFIPTLVLIDENGWILWRHEGRPDRNHIEELEFLIKRQLGIRP